MRKYLYYIRIVIAGKLISMFSIVWYFIIYPFRGTARDIVYNYVLKNNIFLKDLLRYKPYYDQDSNAWVLNKDNKITGYVYYKDVSYWKYFIFKWGVWVWINDRAKYDTIDLDINYDFLLQYNRIIPRLGLWLTNKLLSPTRDIHVIGSAFEKGSTRKRFPITYLPAQLLFIFKVADTNYDYLMYFTRNKDILFYKKIWKFEFGWKECENKDTGITYKLCFFTPAVEKIDYKK